MNSLGGSQKLAARPGRLHLRRIVWARRTAAEDRRYHFQAKVAFDKLAALIVEAKRISSAFPCGHYCSQHVRELRTALYQGQIVEAEARLHDLCSCADALEVESFASMAHDDLAKATAAYLDYPLGGEFTIDGMVRWSRSPR